MKWIKVILVTLLVVLNLSVAQPVFADPIAEKSPEYAEVAQALETFLQAKAHPEESGYTTEQIEQKVSSLQFQKYIMETSEDWGICRNETGHTLAVYAHKPQKGSAAVENTLYYLGDGQETDDDWDCDGIYLPSGANVIGMNLPAEDALTEPIAVKITDGTALVIGTNPKTEAIELNAPIANVFQAGEPNWSIPSLTQADIDAQVLNAPIDD